MKGARKLGGSPELRNLIGAAIRMGDLVLASMPDVTNAVVVADLRDAAIKYTESLSEHDRRRLGYGEKTRAAT